MTLRRSKRSYALGSQRQQRIIDLALAEGDRIRKLVRASMKGQPIGMETPTDEEFVLKFAAERDANPNWLAAVALDDDFGPQWIRRYERLRLGELGVWFQEQAQEYPPWQSTVLPAAMQILGQVREE